MVAQFIIQQQPERQGQAHVQQQQGTQPQQQQMQRKRSGSPPPNLPDGESADIIDEARKFFENPEAWLAASNARLGGETPLGAIEDGREDEVRELLREVRFVGVS